MIGVYSVPNIEASVRAHPLLQRRVYATAAPRRRDRDA